MGNIHIIAKINVVPTTHNEDINLSFLQRGASDNGWRCRLVSYVKRVESVWTVIGGDTRKCG